MALIFSPSIRSAYAYQQFGVEFNLGASTKILIYSGPQPSSIEYQSVFGQKYHSSGTSCLAEFSTSGWTRGANSWSLIDFPAAVTPRLAGEATFAVLFVYTQNTSTSSINSASLVNYVIVPVSDTYGDGVIRFTSTNFTTSTAVSIVDGGFSVL